MDRPENRIKERGNALIYVLIAIALFAGLGFTLGRQTDTSEAGSLSSEIAELRATEIISYAAQAKSSVDQMLFTAATSINQLDFTLPTEVGFDTGTAIHKVYHPQGGGLNPGVLSDDVIDQTSTDPVAGWYMGRPNNVEWTGADSGTNHEVILVAHQIDQTICGMINEKINGSNAIPTISADPKNVLIDDALHSGANVELTTDAADICPDCENMGGLCISNAGATIFSYYTIIADQ